MLQGAYMNQKIIELLLRNKPVSRKTIGYMSAISGALCNIVLFVIKLIVGLLVNSIAITADAFNNLSDLGTNLVSFIGFTYADKPADKDHPFGHGRFEYVSALIISIIILVFSYELIRSSIVRLLNPAPVFFESFVVWTLLTSILVKLWMAFFNHRLNTMMHSYNLDAIFLDSIGDVLATFVVLISVILSTFFDFPFDPLAGIGVALFIGYNGVTILKNTVNALIGTRPQSDLTQEMTDFIKGFKEIEGLHDLIIHDYGPETKLATIHVEMSCDYSFIEAHAVIDTIENQVKEQFGIDLVIHVDPIQEKCEGVLSYQQMIESLLSHYEQVIEAHDFRVVSERGAPIIVFDVVVQNTLSYKEIEKLKKQLNKDFKTLKSPYHFTFNIETKDTFIYQ